MSRWQSRARQTWPRPERLTIIIPAFNEERFVGALLAKVLAVDLSRFGLSKEILVVDDGSTDRTAGIARAVPGVLVHQLARNSGKGAAVRAGLARATGDLVIIQDADLEYEPDDYVPMIEELLRSGAAAVYGSRYLPHAPGQRRVSKHRGQRWGPYLGGRSLSLVQWWYSGMFLTDTVTAFKLMRGPVVNALDLHAAGFEVDHELTVKILAAGHTIREVPIRYHPRSRAEGKKIRARDWFVAVGVYLRAGRRPGRGGLTARSATSRS
jgi:dolichol-phosphate mannosyltransferase